MNLARILSRLQVKGVTSLADGVDTADELVKLNDAGELDISVVPVGSIHHGDLLDIGTNTHAQIDTHIANAAIHRSINDSGTGATDLWSASKINTQLGLKVNSTLLGANNGVATLDSSGLVTSTQLPSTLVYTDQTDVVTDSMIASGLSASKITAGYLALELLSPPIGGDGTIIMSQAGVWSEQYLSTSITKDTTSTSGFDDYDVLISNGAVVSSLATQGSGNVCRSQFITVSSVTMSASTISSTTLTSCTLVTTALGTPTSGTLSNCSGLPASGVTGTAAILGANTFTGVQTYSSNSSASTPVGEYTGTWFTGGTGTTTKPHVLIEPSGTTSTGWYTGGTAFGINAASGYGGKFIDCQIAGTSKFLIDNVGGIIGNGYYLGVYQPGGLLLPVNTARITMGLGQDISLFRATTNTLGYGADYGGGSYFRIMGDGIAGSTYLSLGHDGSNATIAPNTGGIIYTVNSAASTPGAKHNGTWFTGGSATTTKPHLLIEPSGTTSTAWDTNGTGLGVNAATGFTGKLVDLQLAGSSKASIDSAGTMILANGFTTRNCYLGYFAAGTLSFNVDNSYVQFGNTDTARVAWHSSNAIEINNGTTGVYGTIYTKLPTSNPGPGVLWNNGGTPAIGT